MNRLVIIDLVEINGPRCGRKWKCAWIHWVLATTDAAGTWPAAILNGPGGSWIRGRSSDGWFRDFPIRQGLDPIRADRAWPAERMSVVSAKIYPDGSAVSSAPPKSDVHFLPVGSQTIILNYLLIPILTQLLSATGISRLLLIRIRVFQSAVRLG